MQMVYKIEMKIEAMPCLELLPGRFLVSVFLLQLNRVLVEILIAAGLALVKAGFF